VTPAGLLPPVGVLLARVRPGAAILRFEGIPKPARVLALLWVPTTAWIRLTRVLPGTGIPLRAGVVEGARILLPARTVEGPRILLPARVPRQPRVLLRPGVLLAAGVLGHAWSHARRRGRSRRRPGAGRALVTVRRHRTPFPDR